MSLYVDRINTFDNKTAVGMYDTCTPMYPQSVAEEIILYLKKLNPYHTGKFTKMLDVGCGTGKSTQMFPSYFHSILGTDISPAMITEAKQKNTRQNVAFQLVADGKFPCSDDSVNLVTAGGSLHLLDVDNFVKESLRVLRPKGVSAAFTWLPTKICRKDGNAGEVWFPEIYKEFLNICNAHRGSLLWLNGYRDVYKQIDCETKTWIPGIDFSERWSLLDMRRYLSSYADYVVYMAKEKPNTDPVDTFLDELKKNLKIDYEEGEEDVVLEIKFDIPIIVFHKP